MEGEDAEADVRTVIAQEGSTLVDILCAQDGNVLEKIYALVGSRERERLRRLTGPRERISGLVDYFSSVDTPTCSEFLQTVCMFCEGMPMLLESRLMSMAGSVTGTDENNRRQPDGEYSPSSQCYVKRLRLDPVPSYTEAVKSFLLQKYERVTQDVVKEVRLDETWVSLRHRHPARGKDRLDRVPGQAPAEPHEGEESSVEDRVTAESLLGSAGRVVVLLGQPGSGKTLLMHCLGQRWARGAFPSFHLLFLLEFRQLNLVWQPLSLRELLFRFFLPPEDGEDEEQGDAVLSFVLSNPEKICFIFDGYDEFRTKFTHPGEVSDPFDPCCRLPMEELLSGLFSRRILPNCTLLVTCRPRDVTDLFENTGYCIGELLGFDRVHVKEYAEQYFQERGHGHGEAAVSLLMSSRHLLTMSHVPALCHICCVCLDHLFSSEGSHSSPQLPTSLTQIYLHILSAFLSRCQGSGTAGTSTPALERYRTEIGELSRLAMQGLEDSRIVFLAEDLPPKLMDFGIRAGVLSQVELMCTDGSRGQGCIFMHLTMQEFLGALHLLTSDGVSEAKLKAKLNLKTRWTAKSDPKSVFTDSLHLYVCGLAASACTSHLVQLAGGGSAAAEQVQKRQATVLKVLRGFAGNASLTGPKAVELCRCAHETQDTQLAGLVGSRPCFELRNIRLNPVDMDALAFVTSAATHSVGLDFGRCSMELECLDILSSCKNVDYLIFRSRKYDDRFAEALSAILPKLQNLKRLDFICGNLTDAGAAKLARGLADCPQITHLNFSDNSLTDRGLAEIADIFPKLTNATSIFLGKNRCSLDGIFTLIEKMATCSTIQEIHVNKGTNEVNVLFFHNSDTQSQKMDHQNLEMSKKLVLTGCDLRAPRLGNLCETLRSCSTLALLDLSNNSLGNKGLKKLLDVLPQLGTIQEINVSENGVSIEGVVMLAGALCTCRDLTEVNVSHDGKKRLILKFHSRKRTHSSGLASPDDEGLHLHKKLSLTHSDVQPSNMTKLCRKLVHCPNLLDVDFSHGSLRDDTIEKLLRNLPDMTSLQLLNISHVQMSTDGAMILVRSLTDCLRVKAVELRPHGEAFIKFEKVKAEQVTCKFSRYELSSGNVEKLSGILERCPRLADLDLSSNLLRDEGVKSFVDFLPRLRIASSVNLNDNRLTQTGALYVVNSMSTCEKVVAVEVSLGTEDRSLIRFVQKQVSGKTLSLRECSFGADHLQKLMEILHRCPKLIKLELSCNTLHSEGLNTLLNSLAKLSSLQTLTLRNNTLGAEVIEDLVKQLSTCRGHRNIRIEELWIRAEAAVRLVVGCLNMNPNIQEIRVNKTTLNISLEKSTALASSRVRSMKREPLPAVKSISFVDCELQGCYLSLLQPVVQKCHSLQELNLSHNSLGREGAEVLSSVLPALENLRKLSLDSKGREDEVMFEDEVVIFAEGLMQTRSLESLSLPNHVISDRGAAVLGETLQKLPRLRSIDLSQCSGWTATGACDLARGLGQCLSLEGIRLNSVLLDEASIACLAQGLHGMTSVRRLSLNKVTMALMTSEGCSGVLSLLASLEGFSGMEEIELEGMRMGERGVEELLRHIPAWTRLRRISLAENCVSDGAGEKLVEALARCRGLQELNLSRNRLSEACAARLGQVLPTLPQLRVLDLSENQIGAKGSVSLLEGLISMKSLTKLYLTAIGTSELAGVAACLGHCSCIEDVSLAWNDCGDEVALKLAEVLPQCLKLKRLNLESNNISATGAKALAKSLPSCPLIEVIRLWRNPIAKDDQSLKDPRLNFLS